MDGLIEINSRSLICKSTFAPVKDTTLNRYFPKNVEVSQQMKKKAAQGVEISLCYQWLYVFICYG